jgi:four helix bundle protein
MEETQISKLKTQSHNVNLKTDLRNRAYFFSLSVIHFLQNLPEKKIYWSISDQLLRSATSIGANIHEAQDSSSKKEFIHSMTISLKEAELINSSSLTGALQEVKELIKILTTIVKKPKANLTK